MMKKWISTVLSISLVIGMAALLHACGKPKDESETTTETTEESTTVLFAGTDEETTDDNVWADLWDLEGEEYTEPSTNEHYQEEYDALTLPMVLTTQPVAGTTRVQTTTNPAVRETTTQFMFTSPSRASTTAKQAENEGTTAANESTTKETTTKASSTTAPAAAEEETTMLTDYIPTGGKQDGQPMPRPQVTYLDKYVTNIFKSGKFTLEMEQKAEGTTIPITLYEDEDNLAVETTLTSIMMQDMQIPAALSGIGKVRFIVTGKRSSQPKAYIAWTGGYMEMENVDEITDMIREMQSEQEMNILAQMTQEGLEYCGKTSGIGYVCETYKDSDANIQVNFYFAQTPDGYDGIVRWDQVDLSTGSTISETVMRLKSGVTNRKAFKVEGKKMSMDEFENMFNG